MRAWEPGIIQSLLDQGYPLHVAQSKLLKVPGLLIFENDVNNLVVTLGRNLLAKLSADLEAVGLTWHAIGTGITTPVIADPQLTTEVRRKQFATRVVIGAVATFSAFYPKADSTFNIKECGIFGSSTASGTVNSGILFSHFLQSYDNSGGAVDLTYDYDLTMA